MGDWGGDTYSSSHGLAVGGALGCHCFLRLAASNGKGEWDLFFVQLIEVTVQSAGVGGCSCGQYVRSCGGVWCRREEVTRAGAFTYGRAAQHMPRAPAADQRNPRPRARRTLLGGSARTGLLDPTLWRGQMRTGVPAASSARIDLPASLHRLVTLVPWLLPSSSAAQHIASSTAATGRHGLLCPTTYESHHVRQLGPAPWRALVCSPVTRIHPSLAALHS